MRRIYSLVVFSLLALAAPVEAQIQASPLSSTSTVIDGTSLDVTYSRPSVRGRTIWGEVVPWGGRWTPGANWATVIEVDRDVLINGTQGRTRQAIGSRGRRPGQDEPGGGDIFEQPETRRPAARLGVVSAAGPCAGRGPWSSGCICPALDTCRRRSLRRRFPAALRLSESLF